MRSHQFILIVLSLLYATSLASLILPSSSSSSSSSPSSNVYPSIRNANNKIIPSPPAFPHRKRVIINPRAGSNNGNDNLENNNNTSNRVLDDKGYSLPSNSQSSGDYNYDTNSDGPSDNNNNEPSSSRRRSSSSSSNQNDNNNNNNNINNNNNNDNNNAFNSRDNTYSNHPLDARQKLQKHPFTATPGIPSPTNLARVTTTLSKRFSVINRKNLMVVIPFIWCVSLAKSYYTADDSVAFTNTNEFKIQIIGTILSVYATVAANYYTAVDSVGDAAKAFAASELNFAVSMEQEHIERKEVEKAIRNMAIQRPPPHMKYAVVCGRRMVGKSESTAAVFKGRKGVVMVTLHDDGRITVDTIKEKICDLFGLGKSAYHFEALMRAVYKRFGIIPIIIIEIEKDATDPSVMKSAGGFAKDCCWDGQTPCMVYIVPSDNASTDLLAQEDGPRRELIWVGPMSKKEGKDLLGKCRPKSVEGSELLDKSPNFKISDTGLEAIDKAFVAGREEKSYEELFKIVGLHPIDLKGLASTSKDKRKAFVENLEENGSETWKKFNDMVASSEDDSVAEKKMKEGMKDLSKLLLNSGKDGIPVSKVKPPAQEAENVNAFMKGRKVVPFLYHPPSESYRFRNIFVEKAARKAEELKKMWWWTRRKELKRMVAKEMKRKAAEKAEELK